MIYRFHGVSRNKHHYLVSFMNTKDEILKELGCKMEGYFSQKEILT